MSDTAAETSVPPAISPKKRGKASAVKPKKSKTAPSHPKVSEMVTSAITALKERGGSSLQAIKKYIGSHYKVDIERLSPFIKKYLKTAVASGQLVQTKGKGATGSFKLSATGQKTKEKPVKPKKAKKEGTPKKPKTSSVAKKVTKPKKTGDKKKSAPVKKPSAAKKSKPSKSPKKPKVTKPKAPKPKKSPATKKSAPKKTGKK